MDGFGATASRLYTISQAALVLEMDTKTLRKRLRRANIIPLVSEEDRRLHLLTEEQIRQIGATAISVPPASRAETPRGVTVRTLKSLERRVDRVESEVATYNEHLKRIEGLLEHPPAGELRQELLEHVEELERASQYLISLATKQQSRIDGRSATARASEPHEEENANEVQSGDDAGSKHKVNPSPRERESLRR
jgi:hypothetical protein